MRLSFLIRISRKSLKSQFQFALSVILISNVIGLASARATGGSRNVARRIHLKRVIRSAADAPENVERTGRDTDKQAFRLELLRQIKAIDHMKCFPKVLCGLSVDSNDKSFGLNKSNFVRSYLELMRNIKPASADEDYAEHNIRTEAEVEEKLTWPFSSRNPDRKHHSSFEERISSDALSGSDELPEIDSSEYLSRGLDSKLGDTSTSMEKLDHYVARLASSENLSGLPSSGNNGYGSSNSKMPGEKKNKHKLNKSLTAKLTSYFSSWLPGSMGSGQEEDGNDDERDRDDRDNSEQDSSEDKKRGARSYDDDSLPTFPELIEWLIADGNNRKGRSEDLSAQIAKAKDDMNAEHDGDIYHTAVNIGKRLKDPKQCDYIYNGCPLDYDKILDMIGSIRTKVHQLDDTADAVSKEFGLLTTSTTTTTTTTTKKPQRKKPRPSTKIMHTLPNGEKVEINFRLAGSGEDSDEASSGSAQRASLEELVSSDKKYSNRKGTPAVMDAVLTKNKHKKKIINLTPKRNIMAEQRNEDMEKSEEEAAAIVHNQQQQQQQMQSKKSTLKLSGLTLSTADKDEPLEISPSYVIIKHQPLSVHTTSVMSPDNMQERQQQAVERLKQFQLAQAGQKLNAERIADHLKNYLRSNAGLIPKLSLHSSGLITTDNENDPLHHPQNPFNFNSQSFPSPLEGLSLDTTGGGLLQLTSSQLTTSPFGFPQSYSSIPQSSYAQRAGPAMISAVPGRIDPSVIKQLRATTTTTTTTTTPASTTTEKLILQGMPETVSLDTDEITDDTLTKLDPEDTVPSWVNNSGDTPSSASVESGQSESEEDDEQTILENLNKALLSENSNRSKYKNMKKKNMKDKSSGSRVRVPSTASSEYSLEEGGGMSSIMSTKRNRNKQKKKHHGHNPSRENSRERVVIKHAGPYSSISSSPTVYKSPLTGPGPHNGAYPYLQQSNVHVYPGYRPFFRYK